MLSSQSVQYKSFEHFDTFISCQVHSKMTKASLILCVCFVAVVIKVSAIPVPEEDEGLYGDRYQGDIELTDEQKQLIYGGEDVEGNTGMLDTRWRWPMNLNRRVIVPYRIEARQGYSKLLHILRFYGVTYRVYQQPQPKWTFYFRP